MTDGRLEVESKSQECLVIIKREVTSNNLPKRRVLSSTHGVVGGRRLVTASYPIVMGIFRSAGKCIREKIFYLNDQKISFCLAWIIYAFCLIQSGLY